MAETKICPFCAEEIKAAAIKCRYCQSALDGPDPTVVSQEQARLLSEHEEHTRAAYQRVFGSQPELSVEPTGQQQEVRLRLSSIALTKPVAEDGRPQIHVAGDAKQESDSMCNVRLEFQFTTQHDAPVMASHALIEGLRAWETRAWAFQWPPDQWTHLAVNVKVVAFVTDAKPDPDALTRLAAYESALPVPSVPLIEWRGRRHKTRADSVPARCTACGIRYSLSSEVTNDVASALGLFNRLMTFSTVLENATAWSDKAQNRRIASGNEAEREQQELVNIVGRATCPSCGSPEVLLAPPVR